ncbi:molecular chaperone DnaJ, partial [Acinetobacter baumannii]
ASALHPDRELDESERARKTALMQQVNQAYEKNDLSRLLELQLELEQIDQRSIHGVSEERLTHYNHILTEQLGDLDQEIAHMERHL